MLDVSLLLQKILERVQETPLWLILIWLGGTLFVLAQVVSREADSFEVQY